MVGVREVVLVWWGRQRGLVSGRRFRMMVGVLKEPDCICYQPLRGKERVVDADVLCLRSRWIYEKC